MFRAHNFAVRILKKNKGEAKPKNKEGDKRGENNGEEESKRMEEDVIK